uniref:Uncharacterized protein n=1 Tax=Panagrolaimus sp. PS1159 TaxID=55785 RepID=A0AC35GLV9_9BILA
MPPNSGIDLQALNVGYTLELNTVPFKILWISPFYDTYTIDKTPTDDLYDIKKSVTAIFTVLELNITSITTVVLENVNTSEVVTNFTKLGQRFHITDLLVRLVYSIHGEEGEEEERNRVLISIETVKN